MAYISSVTTPDNTTYYVKPYTTTLSSVDLNTITGTGFYSVNNCTNAKFTTGTLVVTTHANTNSCTQMMTDLSTGDVAVRIKSNNIWGSWNDITTTFLIEFDENDDGVLTIGPGETVVENGDSISY